MSKQTWRQYARQLKSESYAVYLACRDPRTPWYAKLLAACVAGYAFSPIDLIPDFIPVLGYLDDLLLVPLGVALALKLIPPAVLAECRQKVQLQSDKPEPRRWLAAGVIVLLWIAAIALVGVVVLRHWPRQ